MTITSEMLEAAHFYGDYSLVLELLYQIEKSDVDVITYL